MPKVTVDGIELEVPQGATVLQASCALPAAEGEINKTDSAMVKKSSLFAFLFFAVFGTAPALASGAREGQVGVGSGPNRAAEVPGYSNLSGSERGRIAARQFAKCMFQSRRKEVTGYFELKMDSELQQKAIDRLVSDRCLSSGTLEFAHWYYRGTLFRAAYLRDFTKFPGTLSSQPVDYSTYVSNPSSGKAAYYLATMAFAQCVVRKDHRSALHFLNAYPGSSNEKAAIAELRPNLAACVPAGSRISLSLSTIEAVLSEAIYREAKAAVAARPAPEASQ